MGKRNRLTEIEAYTVKTRKSEPVGARGKGTLLLERKAVGAISGYYRERIDGKDKRVYLGTLTKKPRSGTDEMDLDSMRLAALRMATASIEAGGIDAHQAVSPHSHGSRSGGSFGDLLTSYVSYLERSGKPSVRQVRSLFKVHVRAQHPRLLQRQASKIRPEDILLVLSEVLARPPASSGREGSAGASASNGMRTTADNLRLALQAAFSYAARAHLSVERIASKESSFGISSNPVRDIPPIQGARRAITESLTPVEMGHLLRGLDGLGDPHRAIVLSLIYFGGQRITQFCSTPWTAVGETTISLLDDKGRKDRPWEHVLPITPRLAEIMAPLLMYRVGPGPFSLREGSTVSPVSVGKLLLSNSRSLSAEGKTRPFNYRNIRVTAETLMAHLGISSEIRAWILSHGRSGVQAKHYDRYSYLPEKRDALIRWGDYLDSLMWGEGAEKDAHVLSRRSNESDER